MTRVAQKKSLGGMLRSLKKQNSTTDEPTNPPSSPGGVESTPRPRKKLSFKEPEIFGKLRLHKSQPRHRPPPLALHQSFSFDENPFEEENSDLEELESQAMRVVRTVGQAFEVCHKLSLNQAVEERDRVNDKDKDTEVENLQDDFDDHDDLAIVQPQQSPTSMHKDISLLDDSEENIVDQSSVPCLLRSQDVPTTTTSTSPVRQSPSGTVTSDCGGMLASSELTALKHEVQLLRERLEQQFQKTRAAVAHARLLQEQLGAETATRVEAQARAHQLFVQNKDLLEHISALVGYRGQERMSDGHATQASQLAGSVNMPQTPTVPDLSSLGQSERAGGQSSPWELDSTSFPYSSYSEPIYVGTPSVVGVKGASSNCNDQLHFQTQLLERLHNISPYQTQRSPYTTPSPYPMGPGLLLPPSSRPSNSVQLSPGSMSLRVSQPNSFSSSPIMSHKGDNYGPAGFEASDSIAESTFIKPLPCANKRHNAAEAKAKVTQRAAAHADDIPPIILDPPPPGRRADDHAVDRLAKQPEQREQPGQKMARNLPGVLRTPGPPPSRTTSARLPTRNDVLGQVQRTTWARHTTK